MGARRRSVLLLTLSVTGIAVIACYSYMGQGAGKIVINEVCSNNQLFTFQSEILTPDYVELYNTGAFDFEEDPLYLSDDEQNLRKVEISSYVIPAEGFFVVDLEDASFGLRKKGGETVYLSDASGNIIDQISLGASDPDFAYARQPDGGDEWGFYTGTPGLSNSYGDRQVAAPVFSHESGFYPESFSLTISSGPDTAVYYTLDGSVPSDHSMLCDGEILVYDRSGDENVFRSVRNVVNDWLDYVPDETPVDKCFIIRAVAVDEKGNSSRVVNAVYFINLDEYQKSNVISLVADPEALFGDDGIYVSGQVYDEWYLGGQEGDMPEGNYEGRGREFEAEAAMEYFSGGKHFSQPVGLRVAGASTRYEHPLKYFNIYARREYGDSNIFDHNFFNGIAAHKVTLRYGHANALCQEIAEGRNVAIQGSVRASLFLNGEFWFQGNILEKYDSRFFKEHYGIDEDNLIVIKKGNIEEGLEEDISYYAALYDYLRNNSLEGDANYQELCRQLDMQSYIDFMCINIYMDNMDFTDTKNVVMWRSREEGDSRYADTKWRWALYDMDAMGWNDAGLWGYQSQAEKDTFTLTPQFVPKINEQTLYSCARRNPEFCRQFVLTFMDLVNTSFLYENVEPRLDDYFYDDSEALNRQYFEDFFRNRADHIVPYLAEEYGLTGTLETVTLHNDSPEAGDITLNTIEPDLSEGAWSGKYYTDYPVTVTATARYGYEFAGWEGTVVSDEPCITVPVEAGGIELYAVFKKSEAQ